MNNINMILIAFLIKMIQNLNLNGNRNIIKKWNNIGIRSKFINLGTILIKSLKSNNNNLVHNYIQIVV